MPWPVAVRCSLSATHRRLRPVRGHPSIRSNCSDNKTMPRESEGGGLCCWLRLVGSSDYAYNTITCSSWLCCERKELAPTRTPPSIIVSLLLVLVLRSLELEAVIRETDESVERNAPAATLSHTHEPSQPMTSTHAAGCPHQLTQWSTLCSCLGLTSLPPFYSIRSSLWPITMAQ